MGAGGCRQRLHAQKQAVVAHPSTCSGLPLLPPAAAARRAHLQPAPGVAVVRDMVRQRVPPTGEAMVGGFCLESKPLSRPPSHLATQPHCHPATVHPLAHAICHFTVLQAKTIDLCNNPMTKEPKLQGARRIIAEWPDLDREAREFTEAVGRVQVGGAVGVGMGEFVGRSLRLCRVQG